jgi:glycosyltransferase involved in cell wall biosynthesis
MTEEPISVIIPAYNAERYIGQALESVASQTYQNWEIIVTDDGGTDATGRLVSEFARKTTRNVMLLEHVQSQGPSAARNTAMKAAKGEYIAFLDADDIWMPEHLGSVCALLASGSADLAYAKCFVFRNTASGEIELLPTGTFEVKNPPADLFRRNFINPSGAAITRRLMEKMWTTGFVPPRWAFQSPRRASKRTIIGSPQAACRLSRRRWPREPQGSMIRTGIAGYCRNVKL